MKIGYARVSTDEQNLDLQLSALKAAGCDAVFHDHGVSGAQFSRPGLEAALRHANDGDTFVVWRLDRLGRSVGKLIQVIERLNAGGVDFQSLTEAISTKSSTGKFIFHMMAAMAEFERSLIGERTQAGMKAARERGKHIGRPRSLTPSEREEVLRLPPEVSSAGIALRFHVHRRTVERIRKQAKDGK